MSLANYTGFALYYTDQGSLAPTNNHVTNFQQVTSTPSVFNSTVVNNNLQYASLPKSKGENSVVLIAAGLIALEVYGNSPDVNEKTKSGITTAGKVVLSSLPAGRALSELRDLWLIHEDEQAAQNSGNSVGGIVEKSTNDVTISSNLQTKQMEINTDGKTYVEAPKVTKKSTAKVFNDVPAQTQQNVVNKLTEGMQETTTANAAKNGTQTFETSSGTKVTTRTASKSNSGNLNIDVEKKLSDGTKNKVEIKFE